MFIWVNVCEVIDMFEEWSIGISIPDSFVAFYSWRFAITQLPIVVLVRKLNGFILPDYSVSSPF